jgi:phage-related protein
MSTVYYRDRGGVEPARVFLDALQPEARATIDLQIDRLSTLHVDDPPLPFPHSSQIEGELRELRCHHGRRLYRILYRRSRGLFVLLHVFRKSSADVPESDKAIAQGRWADFAERMNEVPRRPPRAAGRDAP